MSYNFFLNALIYTIYLSIFIDIFQQRKQFIIDRVRVRVRVRVRARVRVRVRVRVRG
jgi:hypothetical protein